MEDEKRYDDFASAEKMKEYLIPEEFPDGPYGSGIRKMEPVENKSTPWQEGQRRYSAYNYEYKALHQALPRQIDGAHPPHDDPTEDE